MATQTAGKSGSRRKIVALTGTSGFLGSRLLRQLQADRRYGRIVVLDIEPPAKLTRKCQYYELDLTTPAIDQVIADILKQERVETVAHLAFHSNPQRDERMSHELTVVGTLNVLKACDRVHSPVNKLVVQSTTLVYGASHRNPSLLDEHYPLNGDRSYQFIHDKVEVERMLRKLARGRPEMVVTSLRFCPILNERRSDYITHYLEQSVVLTALGYDPLVQFLHPDDALRALKRAVDADYPGALNIVGSGVLYLSTVLQLAKKRTLPVLSPLASPLVDLLWYLNQSSAPGSHLDYLRYSCIASGERAEAVMEFIPQYSTKETLLAYLKRDEENHRRN